MSAGERVRDPGRWRPWAALGLGVMAGCIRVEPFACQGDADCVFQGRPGQCRIAEQTCIYPDEACGTRWSTAQGECMSPVSGGSTGVVEGSESSSGSGVGGSDGSTGVGEGTTAGVDPCADGEGLAQDITGEGMVEASSVFGEGFEPPLGVDGDYGTSWFSSGIELDGAPSVYTWSLAEPRCIARVGVIGNGLHDDPMYREGYGFESLVMRIFDAEDALVFQRMFLLTGTPDPDVVAEPLVGGVRVELELIDHEAFICGGFSELEIEGY